MQTQLADRAADQNHTRRSTAVQKIFAMNRTKSSS
jgi:hypothetical protein